MKKISLFLIALIGCSVMAMADQQQVNCGESVTITATPREHYHFLRWNDGNAENPRLIQNVTGNMSFTAIFAKDTFRVVFNDYAGKAVFTDSVAYLDTPVYGGETPTKPANAQYTYTFSEWSDGNTDNPRQLTPTEDTVLTAFFEEACSVTILTDDDTMGTVSLSAD